jgi:hypothetical protein
MYNMAVFLGFTHNSHDFVAPECFLQYLLSVGTTLTIRWVVPTRREALFQKAKADGVAIEGKDALPHFSQFKVNQGLNEALAKKNGQVAFAASTAEIEVVMEVRGSGDSVVSSETMQVQSTWTGLVLKSVVIQTSTLSGGFGDFVMECGGESFHSRAPIATNPHLKTGATIMIRQRGTVEARRTGET